MEELNELIALFTAVYIVAAIIYVLLALVIAYIAAEDGFLYFMLAIFLSPIIALLFLVIKKSGLRPAQQIIYINSTDQSIEDNAAEIKKIKDNAATYAGQNDPELEKILNKLESQI